MSQLIARRDPPGEPAPIRNLPGYVFRAFVRQVNRLKSKELAVLDAAIAGQTLAQRLAAPFRQLEMKILVDECLAQFDFTERDMCRRRQRIGCPPDSELQRMAEHPVEARDAAASEHLTCCSACF